MGGVDRVKDTSEHEAVTDQRVYALHSLTDEKIAAVETVWIRIFRIVG